MPDKDVTISVSHLPYDPTGVTHIPATWKKWVKEGVIDAEMNTAAEAILFAKLEDGFDVNLLMTLALFADQTVDKLCAMMDRLVAAGMIYVKEESEASHWKSYAVKPEFVYDPKTGHGKA